MDIFLKIISMIALAFVGLTLLTIVFWLILKWIEFVLSMLNDLMRNRKLKQTKPGGLGF